MFRRAVQVAGELMITLGLFLLLFIVWQMWWTTLVSEAQSRDTTAALAQQWEEPAAPAPASEPAAPAVPPVQKDPAGGKPFGIIHIPRFGADWDPRPIVQGISDEDLKHGVGHYPKTVMPGGVGNLSIAGHRVTYGAPFNQIDELKQGDHIVVETETGWYTYKMTSAKIVYPDEVEVVAPVPDRPGVTATERMLTLTACHPEYSARQRYIVHAKFDTFTPRSAGAPATVGIAA